MDAGDECDKVNVTFVAFRNMADNANYPVIMEELVFRRFRKTAQNDC